MLTTASFLIALVAIVIVPRVVVYVGVPRMLAALGRVVGFLSLAAVSFFTGFLSLIPALLVAAAPIITRIISIIYYYWVFRRSLSGKRGEGQKWIAEFVQEDDREFMDAVRSISPMHLKEVIVVANSKQELRQLVIEQAANDGDTFADQS